MKNNYLLIRYSENIENVEYFYNRQKNYWKKTNDVKELNPFEEYVISEQQMLEPILSRDSEGKNIVAKKIAYIPIPF